MFRTLKTLTAIAVASAALGVAVPASAATPDCAGYMDLFSTSASACEGFFDKNVLSNKDTNVAIQEAAVEALLGSNITDFDYNDYVKINASGTTIDFGQTLFGDVIVGIHFGGANGQANNVGNGTGFFLFHFDDPVDFFTTSIPGLSGAVLYTNNTPPEVPEPATWAMMLMGFGATGFALRRRRKDALPQIA